MIRRRKTLVALFISVFLLYSLMLGLHSPILAENGYEDSTQVRVSINENIIVFPDARPFIDEASRVLVPVRFIAENMGAVMSWDGDNQAVSIQKDTKTISFNIGEKSAAVKDGDIVETIELDTKSILVEDRTFVPVRFVSEAFGVGVAWDNDTYTVKLSIKNTSGIPTPSVASTVTPTVTSTVTSSATPSAAPTIAPTPKPVNTNFDFSENPLTEQLAKIKWLGLGIKDGSYDLNYYRPSDNKKVMKVIVTPDNNLFSVAMYWTSDDTLVMAKEALYIGRPEIADEVYSLMLERVRNQGSDIVIDIGAYKVGVVHVSILNYPLNEQGVNVIITGGM